MNDLIVVDLFEVDDLTDMLDHAVTALRITDVRRDKLRHFPSDGVLDAFTAQSVTGRIGQVHVRVTAFTPQQDTP